MAEKKKSTKKKKEIVEEPKIDSSISKEVSLESIVSETINEELKEKEFRVNPMFTTEEKLFITKMVANGYRPFDIVKKARMSLKLSEEKLERLSLNIRTIEQLVKALEA